MSDPPIDPSLRERAARRGLLIDHVDAWGQRRNAAPASLEAILDRLGPPPTPGPMPPCQRATGGAGRLRLVGSFAPAQAFAVSVAPLAGEPGAPWEGRATARPDGGLDLPVTLPHGVYAVVVGDTEATFVWAPPRARPLPGGWGLFAPVHALHDAGAPVHGDLHALGRLADRVEAAGGSFTATLPLLPRFLEPRRVGATEVGYEPSPYAPISRGFWDELLVAAAPVSGRPGPFVEPGEVWRAAWPSLVREAEAHRDEAERWLAAHPEHAAYARFRADAPAARRTFAWAQRVAGRTMAELGSAHALLLDFPLGTHAEGFDVHHHPERFVAGLSVGAPPDALFAGGQDWGFPPMRLDAAGRDGFAHLRRCLEHHMRPAAILRVDHVAWLHRLYCIPAGADARAGVYVRQPAWVTESLYGILTLLSERHRCAVVGEDLGTVPDAVRTAMDAAGLARSWVLQLELGEPRPMALPGAVPPGALASTNTHDLPLFAAWWAAEDVDLFESIGLFDGPSAAAARARRGGERRLLLEQLGLPPDEGPSAALNAALEGMAASEAGAVMVAMEDLWLERRPQNVPGTSSSERPNWRGRAARPIEALDGLEPSPVAPRVLSRRP